MSIGVKMLSGDVILLKEITMEQFAEFLNRANKAQGEYVWVENSLINIRQIEYAADGETPIIKAERETAHWEKYLSEGLRWKCSKCGSRFESPFNYCPNCGAEMDKEEAE